MGKISIHLLKPSDWQIYKLIQLEALKESPHTFGANYHKWSHYSDQKWQERPNNPNSRIFVAKDSEKPIGLVGVYFYDKDANKVADIWGMYLNSDYRRQGIGKSLLTKALNEAKKMKVTKIILMVEYNPNPAQELYKSLGFKPVSTLDYVLGDGKKHQLYKMEKKLD